MIDKELKGKISQFSSTSSEPLTRVGRVSRVAKDIGLVLPPVLLVVLEVLAVSTLAVFVVATKQLFLIHKQIILEKVPEIKSITSVGHP